MSEIKKKSFRKKFKKVLNKSDTVEFKLNNHDYDNTLFFADNDEIFELNENEIYSYIEIITEQRNDLSNIVAANKVKILFLKNQNEQYYTEILKLKDLQDKKDA